MNFNNSEWGTSSIHADQHFGHYGGETSGTRRGYNKFEERNERDAIEDCFVLLVLKMMNLFRMTQAMMRRTMMTTMKLVLMTSL